MHVEESIERLEDLAIAFGAELDRRTAEFPVVQAQMREELSARLFELSAKGREQDNAARLIHFGEMRADVTALAERKRAEAFAELEKRLEAARVELSGQISVGLAAGLVEIKSERQRTVALTEITATLQTFAKSAAAGVLKEYIAQAGEFSESIKKELAARSQDQVYAGKPDFASSFVGNFTTDLELKRGDIFGFQGSSYITLKPSRGIRPTKDELQGEDPRYGLLAARGAPGPAGADGTGGGGGTPGGTSGQIQYNNAGAFGGFTVSGAATVDTATGVMTLSNGTVTLAQMANIDGTAAEVVVGRSTDSSGVPELLATTGTRGSAVVLATSPTLVTPILGTPTSGTLTNCTGYTARALVESVETASNITSDTSAITIAAATTILRLTANAGPFYLAGLTGGASGRRITLCNVGTNTIILKSSIAAIGTAANRFGTAKQDLPLWPGGALNMVYDSTLSLWQVSCPTDRVIPPRVKGWYGVRASFPNLGGDVGVFNAASTVSGTGTNTATAGDSTNPNSYILMSTGTDATGRAAFGSGSTLFLLGNSWYWAAHFRFLVTTLSDVNETFSCVVGFGDSAIIAQTDGAYLRYAYTVNSGNWELVLRSNSAENTPINCTAGPTANTWMDLWIITTPTLVEAYQDGVLIGSTTTLTNLPTGAGRQTGIIASIVKSNGNTARTAQLGLLEVIGYKGTPT